MINITSVDSLSASDVETQQTILTQFIQDKYPNIDLSHGVLHDLVQYLNAVFAAKHLTEMDRWRASRSLKSIQEDPTLAEDDTVDILLSNYNVKRITGACAAGTLFLEFEEDLSVLIPIFCKFTHNGVTYQTEDSFVVYSSDADDTSLADKVLQPLANGYFGVSIPVIAVEPGTAGQMEKGTLVAAEENLLGLVRVYAADTFTGGIDTEDNAILVKRLISGMATPAWGNRYNIESLLRNKSGLAQLIGISIIGYGDKEMRRDTLSCFPVSAGGCVDLYVKPAASTSKTITQTAILQDITCDTMTWATTVPAATLYGFWRVSEIHPVTDTLSESYDIISQTPKSINPEYDDLTVPYTVYQDMDVVFQTGLLDGELSIGDSANFDITTIGIADLDTVQHTLSDPDYCSLTADVLAHAAVPCFLGVSLSLVQSSYNQILDTQIASIKSAICSYVNNTDFCSYISSADIVQHIQDLLLPGQGIKQVQLSGTIMIPGGSVWRATSPKNIQIPNLPEKQVTKRTTAFFTNESLLEITLA